MEQGIRDDNFFDVLQDEIDEGRQYYDSRVPLRVRRDTEIYTETLQQFVQMKREELRRRLERRGTRAMSADPQTHRAGPLVGSRRAAEGGRSSSRSRRTSATLPLMFELLGDKDWRVRKTIVDGFVRDARPEIVDGLLDALADPENAGKRNSVDRGADPDRRVGHRADRRAAAQRAGHRRPPLARQPPRRPAQPRGVRHPRSSCWKGSTDINVASSIVSSLGKYRDAARAAASHARAAQRDDLWLKFHVIEALGEIGDRAALPAILPLYAEKSLRKPVLEAVGKIADVGTVNFLLRIIADEEKLNLTALRALVRIAEASKPRIVEEAERQLHPAQVPRVVPARRRSRRSIEHLAHHAEARGARASSSSSSAGRATSARCRCCSRTSSSPRPRKSRRRRSSTSARRPCRAILEALQQRGRGRDRRRCCCASLNVIGGREAIPSILPFLDHDNPMIRRLAIETLGEIPDPRVDRLPAGQARRPRRGVAAGGGELRSRRSSRRSPEIKGEVLAKIRRLLQSPSIPMKLNSLSVYVNIQGEGYHDELLLASKDSDPVIRQKAVSLMGKFGEERFADQLVLSLADEVDGRAAGRDQRHRPSSAGDGTRAADQRLSTITTSGSAPRRRRRSASTGIPTRSSR